MAYSNWGAFVFCNGERQPNKEDVPPYGDADVEAVGSGARIWVNLLKARADGKAQAPHERCHHAVLGQDRLRLCGYKSYPELYLAGDDGLVVQLNIAMFRIDKSVNADDWEWHDSEGIEGEVDGFKFKAWPGDEPEHVDLELTEPDGTKWTGKSGYCMGAGFEDD
jgi:hypothetical protein